VTELPLYSATEMAEHQKGHPRCKYCKQHYYSADELFAHMRARHFGCEVCQRRDGAFHYFRDAEGLTEHLRFVSHLLQLVASATHTILASCGPVATMCLGDVLLVCTSSWRPIESVFSR